MKARAADVQREAASLAQVAAQATALESQIAQLEAGRFAGLDVAQAALTECTLAADQAGAAAAAEESPTSRRTPPPSPRRGCSRPRAKPPAPSARRS